MSTANNILLSTCHCLAALSTRKHISKLVMWPTGCLSIY